VYRLKPGVQLVLASASPRRQRMLDDLGLTYSLAPAQVDESIRPGETAAAVAQRLARGKAAAAFVQWPGRVILAADTVVALGGEVLGKPTDRADARRMLRALAGREHQVLTGYCLTWPGREEVGLAESRVRFRPLMEAEIEAYLTSGEPMDKAGAYAVQGLAAAFVEEVAGSYTNVVGLPLSRVVDLLLREGFIEPHGEAFR